jgi:uncharacterized protein (DUF486 family)
LRVGAEDQFKLKWGSDPAFGADPPPLNAAFAATADTYNPMTPLQSLAATATLLAFSNLFMTFAWYGHLKHLQASPWWIAALVSWGIALAEYLLQVPANRIGFANGVSLAQLKILQEVITLAVFVPFAILYMGESLKLDYLWAALCMVGAVYFIFR